VHRRNQSSPTLFPQSRIAIVDTFLATLTAEEGMEAVAKRLRQALLEHHSYSEASLRSALFDEGTP